MNSNLLRQKAIEWPSGGREADEQTRTAPYNSAPFRRDLHILQRTAETGGRQRGREACKIVKTVPTEEKERREGRKEGGREGSVCRLRSRRRRRRERSCTVCRLVLRKKKKWQKSGSKLTPPEPIVKILNLDKIRAANKEAHDAREDI